MKIINYGQKYEIYPDNLKTFDQLPAQTYKIGFSKMQGFFLTQTSDLNCTEEKIYGSHQKKVDKMMRTFKQMNRSLGVILSGKKGIGKTMSIQLLSKQALDEGIPVVIVDENIPGIDGYIDSIEQEVIVVFDEFEKKFSRRPKGDGMVSQEDFLGLFDGMSAHKRMYVVTVNDVSDLNEYLLNRPGRFHYHIRYDYPNRDEIIEYLNDKVGEDVPAEEIKAVADFGMRTSLNFDMLRAIVFELSLGESFKSVIDDLNIMNIENESAIDTVMTMKDGRIYTFDTEGNLFEQTPKLDIHFWGGKNKHDIFGKFSFDGSQATYTKVGMVIKPEAITEWDVNKRDHEHSEFDDDDRDHVEIDLADVQSIEIKTIETKKAFGYNLNQ